MGFLNPTDDDDYRISQMAGTTEVPAAGALQGLLTSIPKGITSAGLKIGSLADDTFQQTDLSKVYAKFQGLADQSNEAMTSLGLPETLPIVDKDMRAKAAAATQVAADWAATGTDPRTTGVVGRIASQTTEGISIGAVGSLAGPWGAATLLGTTEGHSTYLEAKQNGMDDNTAMEQAGVAGVFSAASAFVPMKFGKTLVQSVVGGSAMNVGFGAAQRLATSTILKENGYTAQADQYRVFDGEAMASDAILGAAFGTLGHYTHGAVSPADVDAASAVATEEHFNRSAPGIPTDPTAANLHAQTMADSLERMANGEMPYLWPDTAQKIMDGILPDPIHDNVQALHEAALEDLPGYEEAIAQIDRQEPPPEQLAPWRAKALDIASGLQNAGEELGPYFPPAIGMEILGHLGQQILDPEAFAGLERRAIPEETAAPARDTSTNDVLLDDFHQDMLDHLVHNYGNVKTFTDDGREVTYRQLAGEMQQQRNGAENYGRAIEAAASCAARNGA